MKHPSPEFEDAIAAVIGGTAAEEQARALGGLLRADEKARADYLWRVELHARLVTGESFFARQKSKVIALPPPRTVRVWAAAACLALIAGGAALFLMKPDGIIAQVVHAERARLEGRAEMPRVGEEFAAREINLSDGMLRLRLRNGVLLDLHAPLLATLESPMRLRLRHGRMNADVGQGGNGFTVITDAGEIVDLGTRFGVEADAKGESRVAVFSGQVKVRNGGAGSAFTTLQVGEAVRFTGLARMQTWQQVALAADASGLAAAPSDGAIEAVRDNRGDEQLHPFYGVMRGGLQRGAQLFVDRLRPRLAPGAGETIPEWLDGADLILTYHRFRNQPDYELTLTLRAPATIFVMMPVEREPPNWLEDGFVKTGAQMAVGPAEDDAVNAAGNEPRTTRRMVAVWRADVAAGRHVLGGLRDDHSPDLARVSYSVAVKPLKSQP